MSKIEKSTISKSGFCDLTYWFYREALRSGLLATNRMAPPPPGPYSGVSTLALVARASAFSFGLVYGSVKLKVLKMKANSQKKADSKAHH